MGCFNVTDLLDKELSISDADRLDRSISYMRQQRSLVVVMFMLMNQPSSIAERVLLEARKADRVRDEKERKRKHWAKPGVKEAYARWMDDERKISEIGSKKLAAEMAAAAIVFP